MTGSPASVSAEDARPSAQDSGVLVCGTNWVGDSVTSMPALQAFRRRHPDARVTLLIKPAVRPLWALHPVPDRMVTLEPGLPGVVRAARQVRGVDCASAYVLPRSFRAALVPFLAGVPVRAGLPGHARDFMLTEIVRLSAHAREGHQVYEYLELFGCTREAPEPPVLDVPSELRERVEAKMVRLARPRVGLMPGAARGPAKRWPAGHFQRLGRALAGERKCAVLVFGTAAEAGLCEVIAEGIGPDAVSFAGCLSMAEWIAAVASCDLVVANDSGGMHVAAALNTPVVALFGHTDPHKTGPLSASSRVIQNSATRSRDVGRRSKEARKNLASILPERVYEVALELLETAGARRGGDGHA